MKLTKTSITSLITYFIIFLAPSIINLFMPLKGKFIMVETVDYLLGALILIFINFHSKYKNKIEQNKTNWLSTILWGILGLGLVLFIQIFINFITIKLGQNPNSQNTTTIIGLAKINPWFVLAISFGAPIMEELIFRRVLFGNLVQITNVRGKIGYLTIAVLSSILFALMHNDGHLLLYTSMGLVFCYLYYRTGKIQTSMIAHVLMNTVVILPILIH